MKHKNNLLFRESAQKRVALLFNHDAMSRNYWAGCL